MNKSKIIVYVMFLAFILFPVNSKPLYVLIFENLVTYLNLLLELSWRMSLFMAFNCFVMIGFLIWLFPFSFYYWSKAINEFESLNALRDRARKHKDIPKVAVVIPAFNEEKTIVQTIRSCQLQSWKPSQIIIVDDGSTDGMLDLLVKEFKLVRKNNLTFPQTLRQKGIVEARYSNGNITLISKENAGKGFALNCGFDEIDRRSIEYACIFDADTIASPEGIMGLVYPMVEDKDLVLTSGRNQVINGCQVLDGEVINVGITWNPLILSQIKEYINDLVSKAFGNAIDASTVLIGNFSAYRVDVVYHPSVQGFDNRGLTEDYDYNFGIQACRKIRRDDESKGDWKVRTILNAQGWTQAPHSLSGIYNQRLRWSGGILDTLMRGWDAWLLRPMRTITTFHLIKALIFPVMFVANFLLIPFAIYFWLTHPEGHLIKDLVLYFYLPAYVIRFVLETVLHNYIDWKYIRNYEKPSTYVFLALVKMAFGYVYNSILLVCNAVACWRLFKGTGKWGKMERTKVD
jgi:cellulose synthase/poly-beta-1,6-N-acetylglucosamine synthase-like glycosyltransferase